MYVVLNLSHPLSENAEKILRSRYGDVRFVRIPVQVNLDSADGFAESLSDIFSAISLELDNDESIIAVIPPGLSIAALAIVNHMPRQLAGAEVIGMVRTPGNPPEFLPKLFLDAYDYAIKE